MGGVEVNCAKLTEDDPISKLEFHSRIETCLRTAHKVKIGDLTELCACGVLDIPGIGWDSMETIIDTLRDVGFNLNRECQARPAAKDG